MKELENLFSILKKKYEEHQKFEKEYEEEIKPKIDREIWATEPQHYLELLKIERARIPKGRILKTEPERKNNCVKLGYDTNDNLVYEEEWETHPTHGYKKYFVYSKETIYGYKFNRESKLIEIEYQKLKEGLPVWYGSYALDKANTIDKYEYQDRKLILIKSMWHYKPYIQYPSYYISYDTFENIKTIRRVDEVSDFFPEGQDMIVYKKHNYSIKQLTEILIEEFIKCIEKEIIKNEQNDVLMITLEGAFNSDDWLPYKFYFSKSKVELNENLPLEEYIDFGDLKFEKQIVFNEKLMEASELLMQELELKEKYDLPHKILIKLGKKLREKEKSVEENSQLKILLLDFPDDWNEDVFSILSQLYSKTEIKKIDN